MRNFWVAEHVQENFSSAKNTCNYDFLAELNWLMNNYKCGYLRLVFILFLFKPIENTWGNSWLYCPRTGKEIIREEVWFAALWKITSGKNLGEVFVEIFEKNSARNKNKNCCNFFFFLTLVLDVWRWSECRICSEIQRDLAKFMYKCIQNEICTIYKT